MNTIILDLETTGFPKNQGFNKYYPITNLDAYDSSRVIQIAWVVIDENNRIIQDNNYTVKPIGFTITNHHIHNITQEDALKKGKNWDEIIQALQEDFANCKLLIGHNIAFDYNVLRSELLRHTKIDIINVPTFCTMEHAKSIYKVWKFFKLPELYLKLFNEPFDTHHNALEDIYVTARCYYQMTQNIDIKNEIENARKEMR
jgi:DNA polymerase-3 subunit alpha